MTIPHLQANARRGDVAATIEASGGVIINRAASAEFKDQLAAELRLWIEKTPTGIDEFAGRRTRRTGGLIPLGYVDDLRDPMEFVRPDLAKRGMAR